MYVQYYLHTCTREPGVYANVCVCVEISMCVCVCVCVGRCGCVIMRLRSGEFNTKEQQGWARGDIRPPRTHPPCSPALPLFAAAFSRHPPRPWAIQEPPQVLSIPPPLCVRTRTRGTHTMHAHQPTDSHQYAPPFEDMQRATKQTQETKAAAL